MGEYALYQGQQIKIGTCEDMYYLRADQAHLVTAQRGNVDPVKDRNGLRFRFPFPEEDDIEPGNFEDYNRRQVVHGANDLLELIDPESHYRVQFKHEHGYLVCLPCPEIGAADGFDAATGQLFTGGREYTYKVGRNGFKGSLFIKQQRYYQGELVTVVECACGAAFRLEELAQAERLAVALRSEAEVYQREADRDPRGPYEAGASVRLNLIADRVLAGYSLVSA